MSSPIAIPTTRRATSAARSLPAPASPARGLYVPVHRRGASSSSLPEHSPLRARRPSSPANVNRYGLLASATIPPASTIPQTRIYSLTTLLSLASSPSSTGAALSPSQHAELASHIPLMARPSPAPRALKPQPAETAPAPADAPKKPEAPRRRRTGRKPSSAKARGVGADVEGRRRRTAYGAGWGWSAAERVAGQRVDFGRVPQQEESWRAARVLAATA